MSVQHPGRGPARQRILLVGMMGAGKSQVARLVARRLGWSRADTDEMVEAEAGMSVAEMFASVGEAEFRVAESRAIAALRETTGPLVVSLGGGSVLSSANRELIRSLGAVAWLRAKPLTLARRVGQGKGRPLLATANDRPAVALERIAAERQHLYAEVADVVIDVDGLSPGRVASRLLAELGELADLAEVKGAGR